MDFHQKTRDLARDLIASEIDAGITSLQTQPATVRVYEKLRSQLGGAVGVEGFQAFASRALSLARSGSTRLSAVQLTATGELQGLAEVDSQTEVDQNGEAGIVLIAELLGLFLTFLGEATTLRLIEDLRVQIDVASDFGATIVETVDPAADEVAMSVTFGDLLLEIDRLRKVSDRVEILADRHTSMEEGLVSVAGNIRSIATILDVFTLIRSKAGGSQEAPNLQTNRFMN